MRGASHFYQTMAGMAVHSKLVQTRAIIAATVPENLSPETMGAILWGIDDNLKMIQDELDLYAGRLN